MWTVVVQFGGGEGTTECGLVRCSLGEERGRLNVDCCGTVWGGEGTTECGLLWYSLGEEWGRLNVDCCGTVWGRRGDG